MASKRRQTFDGNDYQATHVIVYAGDEPIGTLRIRWFKDFAKFERTAFRKAYRNAHPESVRGFFLFDHVARKGYDKVITHAQPKYARLWRIVSRVQEREGKKPVYFEGHEEPYIELVKELTPPANAISDAPTRPSCSGPRASGMRLASTRRSPVASESNARKSMQDLVDFFRTYLRQVVAIHQAMFEKLLFEEGAPVGLDLAELFQDVGRPICGSRSKSARTLCRSSSFKIEHLRGSPRHIHSVDCSIGIRR